MSWLLEGQRKELFLNKQNISKIFILRLECELCVYRREKGETEMITRVFLRTQLGASLE